MSSVVLVQDFRSRAISWWTLPPLALAGVALVWQSVGFELLMWNTVINIALFGSQFLFVALVHKLRKPGTPFIDRQIGKGDLLYLASCAPLYSVPYWSLWYAAGLLFSLAGYAVLRSAVPQPQSTVPLAGLLAAHSIIFIAVMMSLGHRPWNEPVLPFLMP